jgi:hypothetical protein
MNNIILSQLLPQQWHRQQEVYWQPPEQQLAAGAAAAAADASAVSADSNPMEEMAGPPLLLTPQQQQQPSRALLRLFWEWMAPRSDAADLTDWPVVPVSRGKLRQLQQPAQVSLPVEMCDCLPCLPTQQRRSMLQHQVCRPSHSSALPAYLLGLWNTGFNLLQGVGTRLRLSNVLSQNFPMACSAEAVAQYWDIWMGNPEVFG